MTAIAQSLLARLAENHRCLYLNSPTMVAGMRSQLAAEGLSVREEIARGSLILSSDQSHLIDGKFDTERMIGALKAVLDRAVSDGYVGLWASGDMTWEFGSEANLDKLLAYERRLELFMQEHPMMSGVCLYHRDTLPAHAIQTAHATHPAFYVNATLSQLNPAYH